MKRKLAIGVLFLPVFFVLLHAFTPHHHLPPSGNSFDIGPAHSCPSGLLSDVFNFSPGEHHLEEYQVSNLNFDFAPEQVVLTLLDDVFTTKPFTVKNNITSPSTDWDDPFLKSSTNRRGPPQLMI